MNEERYNSFEEEFSVSIDRYKEMLKRNTSSFFDVFEFENIIDYYLDQKNFAKAKQAAQYGIRQHPSASSLRLKLANILIESGKPSEGLVLLREIEMLEKINPEFFLIKGIAYNFLGKQTQAIQEFDKAITLTTENRDEMIYNIAYSFIQLDRIPKAIKYLLLACEIDPENPLYMHELALCYEKQEDYIKSITYYKKYLDLDPFAENIWFNLGILYAAINDYDNSLEAFDYAIAIHPGYSSAHYNKASTLMSASRYDEAIDIFNELIALEKDNIYAHYNLAECYEKKKEYQKAIKIYENVIKIDHSFADAWFGIGMVFFNQKKYNSAEYNIIKAIKLDTENPDYWFTLAELYQIQKNNQKAADAYKKTVELDPNDYEAWIAYAKIRFDEQEVKDAINILNEAQEYNHNVSTLSYQLAAYYYFDNNKTKASQYFEKGLELNFTEHEDIINRFPGIKKNKVFNKLIRKYNKYKK